MSDRIIVLAKRYVGHSGPGPIYVYEPVKCPACEGGELEVDGYEGAACGLCQGFGELFADGHYDPFQAKVLAMFASGDDDEHEQAWRMVFRATEKMAERTAV